MALPAKSIRIAAPVGASQPHNVPVARPYMPTADAILPYLKRIDEARWYSNFGPLMMELEARLAQRFAAPTATATVVNGTQALTVGLQAMGVAPGGFCAIPSWTFVATAHAVVAAGMTPWFVDVDPLTAMLDPMALETALACAPGEVKAAVPVAAFGRPIDVDGWSAFRNRTGVPVLIDAAAAFDTVDRAPLPTVFSLHATKILGTGEGGFIACEDEGLVRRFREITSYGFRGRRESESLGTNAKLSEYACAVGLAGLDAWSITRLRYLRAAQLMRIALTPCLELSFQPGWGVQWVSTTCIVNAADAGAAALERRLKAAGVDTRRWWGMGCHASPAFAAYPRTQMDATDRLARSSLGLPFYADMTAEDIERVASAARG
jgi:dTDP-4-amino-4,6-dideoxygalactose transaminase